jgi:hypothetical protein
MLKRVKKSASQLTSGVAPIPLREALEAPPGSGGYAKATEFMRAWDEFQPKLPIHRFKDYSHSNTMVALSGVIETFKGAVRAEESADSVIAALKKITAVCNKTKEATQQVASNLPNFIPPDFIAQQLTVRDPDQTTKPNCPFVLDVLPKTPVETQQKVIRKAKVFLDKTIRSIAMFSRTTVPAFDFTANAHAFYENKTYNLLMSTRNGYGPYSTDERAKQLDTALYKYSTANNADKDAGYVLMREWLYYTIQFYKDIGAHIETITARNGPGAVRGSIGTAEGSLGYAEDHPDVSALYVHYAPRLSVRPEGKTIEDLKAEDRSMFIERMQGVVTARENNRSDEFESKNTADGRVEIRDCASPLKVVTVQYMSHVLPCLPMVEVRRMPTPEITLFEVDLLLSWELNIFTYAEIDESPWDVVRTPFTAAGIAALLGLGAQPAVAKIVNDWLAEHSWNQYHPIKTNADLNWLRHMMVNGNPRYAIIPFAHVSNTLEAWTANFLYGGAGMMINPLIINFSLVVLLHYLDQTTVQNTYKVSRAASDSPIKFLLRLVGPKTITALKWGVTAAMFATVALQALQYDLSGVGFPQSDQDVYISPDNETHTLRLFTGLNLTSGTVNMYTGSEGAQDPFVNMQLAVNQTVAMVGKHILHPWLPHIIGDIATNAEQTIATLLLILNSLLSLLTVIIPLLGRYLSWFGNPSVSKVSKGIGFAGSALIVGGAAAALTTLFTYDKISAALATTNARPTFDTGYRAPIIIPKTPEEILQEQNENRARADREQEENERIERETKLEKDRIEQETKLKDLEDKANKAKAEAENLRKIAEDAKDEVKKAQTALETRLQEEADANRRLEESRGKKHNAETAKNGTEEGTPARARAEQADAEQGKIVSDEEKAQRDAAAARQAADAAKTAADELQRAADELQRAADDTAANAEKAAKNASRDAEEEKKRVEKKRKEDARARKVCSVANLEELSTAELLLNCDAAADRLLTTCFEEVPLVTPETIRILAEKMTKYTEKALELQKKIEHLKSLPVSDERQKLEATTTDLAKARIEHHRANAEHDDADKEMVSYRQKFSAAIVEEQQLSDHADLINDLKRGTDEAARVYHAAHKKRRDAFDQAERAGAAPRLKEKYAPYHPSPAAAYPATTRYKLSAQDSLEALDAAIADELAAQTALRAAREAYESASSGEYAGIGDMVKKAGEHKQAAKEAYFARVPRATAAKIALDGTAQKVASLEKLAAEIGDPLVGNEDLLVQLQREYAQVREDLAETAVIFQLLEERSKRVFGDEGPDFGELTTNIAIDAWDLVTSVLSDTWTGSKDHVPRIAKNAPQKEPAKHTPGTADETKPNPYQTYRERLSAAGDTLYNGATGLWETAKTVGSGIGSGIEIIVDASQKYEAAKKGVRGAYDAVKTFLFAGRDAAPHSTVLPQLALYLEYVTSCGAAAQSLAIGDAAAFVISLRAIQQRSAQVEHTFLSSAQVAAHRDAFRDLAHDLFAMDHAVLDANLQTPQKTARLASQIGTRSTPVKGYFVDEADPNLIHTPSNTTVHCGTTAPLREGARRGAVIDLCGLKMPHISAIFTTTWRNLIVQAVEASAQADPKTVASLYRLAWSDIRETDVFSFISQRVDSNVALPLASLLETTLAYVRSVRAALHACDAPHIWDSSLVGTTIVASKATYMLLSGEQPMSCIIPGVVIAPPLLDAYTGAVLQVGILDSVPWDFI